MKTLCFVILFGSLTWIPDLALAQNERHGAENFALCAGCHGFRGEGSRMVSAPAISGLETWYLEQQIRNFREGVRGGGEDDAAGQTMVRMTQGLRDEGEILDLVAYIDTLPAPDPAATVSGDVERGRELFRSCTACHGPQAEGNRAMNAPGLVTIDDWYQLTQLKKFRNGLRGADPADSGGRQMASMAKALPDEQAMKDVIAYIDSLR